MNARLEIAKQRIAFLSHFNWHRPISTLVAILLSAVGLATLAPTVEGVTLLVGEATLTCIEGTSGVCSSTSGTTQTISERSSPGTGTVVSSPLNLEFGLLAQAGSDFGTLRAKAGLSFNNFTWDPNWNQVVFETKAEARLLDTLTFSAGKFVEFRVGATGSNTSIDNQGHSHSGTGGFFLTINGSCGGITPANCFTSFGTGIAIIPIPASGIVNLNADLVIDLGGVFFRPEQTVNGSASVDVSHTIQIDSAVVLDANHQPIVGATISAESGHDYAAAAVPLPASLLLFGSGLAGCGFVRRRVT